jgi:hypothetical protein
MHMHSSWVAWFINNNSNDAGNRNLQAFSDILSSGDSNKVKLRACIIFLIAEGVGGGEN